MEMAEHTTTNYKIQTSGPSYMTKYYKVKKKIIYDKLTSLTELINFLNFTPFPHNNSLDN